MWIKEKIEKWVRETLETNEVVLVHPKEIKNGDYTLILPPLSIRGGQGVIEKLVKNKLPEIKHLELANERFINIYLSEQFFAESVQEVNEKGKKFGETKLLEGKKIVIEHTQPNPFKQFHIGHLMNNAIGESVTRILKANGADVKTCSYHGDVGLHVAKTIWGLRISDQVSLISRVDIHTLGQAYARGSIDFEKSDHAKESVLEINKIIYSKREDNTNSQWVNNWYKQGKDASLDYFESIYKKLDSNFDKHFFESESGEIGKGIVKENIGKIFEESEGAVVFRGENFEPKTHTRVFLNKDGLPTYEAKELGLAKMKVDKFGEYDQSITVTANEQDSFFDVVEVAIGEIFHKLKGKLKHLSHGMLRLPSGKMSSRTGDVITAESLIDQVKEKVREKINASKHIPLRVQILEEREMIEQVAIGAIKYSILRQAIGGDIVFDFDKSISFEGDSGPYLQYSYVRAKSVLEKADPAKNVFSKKSSGLLASLGQTFFSKSFLRDQAERPASLNIQEVEKLLYRFPEVVERAGREYAPHHLVTYLTELASAFNSFYGNEKIINEGDSSSAYKVALTEATAHVLKNGLHLLGIKVPERM